jgi:hypothetical protein
MNEHTKIARLLTLVTVLVVAGCSGISTVDEATSSIDCRSVCKRYADCFDSAYDVDGCSDKCQNSADSSDTRQRRLKACDTCIDERSCTDATFNCASDCAGIVP